MKKLLVAGLFAALAATAGAQTVTSLVTTADIAGFVPGAVDVSSTGKIAFVNEVATGNEIYVYDPSLAPGSRLALVGTAAAMRSAIDALNPADLSSTIGLVRDVAWLANGKIAVYWSESGNLQESLLTVDPATTTVTVLITDTTGTNPIGAFSNLETIGNNIYFILESSFTATNDSLEVVDAASAGTPGSFVFTTVATEANLRTAAGESTANAGRISDLKAVNATTLLGHNSGGAASTDDVISIDVTNGTATSFLLATDVEADIGAPLTDIGGGSIAWSGTTLYIFNNFGTGLDDFLSKTTGISGGVGTSSVYFDEAALGTAVGAAGADFSATSARQMDFDTTNNRLIVSADGSTFDGIIAISEATAVNDWAMY